MNLNFTPCYHKKEGTVVPSDENTLKKRNDNSCHPYIISFQTLPDQYSGVSGVE